MDVLPRPQRKALGTCLHVLVLFIACDKSHQFVNPVPISLDTKLYMAGSYKFPGDVVYNLLRCPLEQTCRNRCDRVRIASNLYCQCDQLCWLYGDCCVDYYSICLGVDVANPDSVVLGALLAQLRSYYDFLLFYEAVRWARLSSCQNVNGRYMQVVRSCSGDAAVRSKFERLQERLSRQVANESAFVGMSSADIVYECENLLTDDDAVTVPVSLNKVYTVHFYNVFCAICNGINPYDAQAWSVSVRFKNVSRLRSTAQPLQQEEILVSEPLGLRWCIQYRDDLLRKDQSLTGSAVNEANGDLPAEPALGVNANTTYDLCKATDSVPSEFSLSRRYLRPYVTSGDNMLLKNQHCALCSGAKIVISCLTKQCLCPETYSRFITYISDFNPISSHGSSDFENLPNLKDLFYFRDKSVTKWVNETVVNTEVKACPENTVFSRFNGRCVDVVCPDGMNSTGGRCPGAQSCDEEKGPCDGNVGRTTAESELYPRGSTAVTLSVTIQRVSDQYGVGLGQNKHMVLHKEIDINARLDDGKLETTSPFTSTINSLKGETVKPEHIDDTNSKVNEESPISFQNMKSMWISQISSIRSWNFTETFFEIMRNIDLMPDITDNVIQMKDVQFSVKTNESCLVAEAIGIHGNSSRTGCQLYIDVKFIYNESQSSSAFLSLAEKEIIPQLIASAHKNNHVLSDVRLTNADFGGYGLDEGTTFNAGEVCSSGRRAENMTVNVTADDNGTYMAHFDRFLAYPIDHFKFSLAVKMDETAGDVRLEETAVVVVCVVNISMSNCSMVFYSSADIVQYDNHLIITKQAYSLLDFLEDSSAPIGKSLSDILKKFADTHNVSDIEIHPQGVYVMSTSGAYVCSDYSRNYSIQYETVAQVPHMLRSTSDSIPERIATVLTFAVSITCLVAVLVVYSLVPELRNTPGKIVMSMSGTLLLAQVMLLCAAYPKGLACKIYAATQHAAWLSSSAWLAAMAAHLRHVLYSQSKLGAKSIFGLLAFLSWGLPSLMAGCCFTLDRIGLIDLEYDSGEKCWVNNIQFALFAFGVPFFLLVATTFICGVCIVRAIQKSSDFVNKVTRDRQRVRSQLLLCINMAFLMGLSWAIYFVAQLADTEAVWIIFILANGSQGLFVFLCYAAKKSVVMKLTRRWRHEKALSSESTSPKSGSTWVISNK